MVYPMRFLEGEDVANNFLFNADRYVFGPSTSFGTLTRRQAVTTSDL